jgi:outer membrane protein TolC
MIKAKLLMAGVILALPLSAQDQPRELTLDQCVQAALAAGLDNAILRDTLQVAREQYLQVVASDSFSMSGAVGYTQDTTPRGNLGPTSNRVLFSAISTSGAQASLDLGGPLTSLSLSASPYLPAGIASTLASSVVEASFKQTLWNGYPGGPLRAAVQKGLLSLQGQELTESSGRLALIQSIQQAYYVMLSAQRAIVVGQQNLAKQNSFVQQMQAIYDLKQASLTDLQTAQINARSAEIDMRTSQHNLHIARLNLAGLMGLPAGEAFSVAEVEDPQPLDFSLEEAIRKGLAQRVELRQVGLNRKSNAIDLALARWQSTPSVSLNAGGVWFQDWGGDYVLQGQAGVDIGLPLVDSGLAAKRRVEKERQGELYALQDRQLRRNITEDITNAYGQVGLQLERLALARQSAENLDLVLEQAKVQNSFGTLNNQDLLTASVNAANGHMAVVQARINALLAVLTLRAAMGE